MLYMGTATKVLPSSMSDLRIEVIDDSRQSVRQWFSQPEIRFVGAHTGCSCGFPSVLADSPVEYYEGMPLDSDDRAADLRSVRALIDLIAQILMGSEVVELYPVADGDQGNRPKGIVEWRIDALDPERFFFNEGFKHLVRGRPTDAEGT